MNVLALPTLYRAVSINIVSKYGGRKVLPRSPCSGEAVTTETLQGSKTRLGEISSLGATRERTLLHDDPASENFSLKRNA